MRGKEKGDHSWLQQLNLMWKINNIENEFKDTFVEKMKEYISFETMKSECTQSYTHIISLK